MTPRGGAAILVVLAVLGGAAFADQVVPAQARALSERARAAHARGDFARAIVAYRAAYAIAPSPGLLFNLGQAYRLAGDCAAAASYYRRYLAADGEPAARSLAATQLARVEVCVAAARPVAAPVAVRAVAPAGGRGLRRAGLGLAGGGGVLVLASAALAFDAHRAAAEVSRGYASGAAWPSLAAADARGRRSSALATGAVITGALAISAGGTLYWLGRRARGTPIVTGSVGARAARMELTWQF